MSMMKRVFFLISFCFISIFLAYLDDETSRFCSSERAAADNLGAQPLGDLGQGELAPAAPLHRPRGVLR